MSQPFQVSIVYLSWFLNFGRRIFGLSRFQFPKLLFSEFLAFPIFWPSNFWFNVPPNQLHVPIEKLHEKFVCIEPMVWRKYSSVYVCPLKLKSWIKFNWCLSEREIQSAKWWGKKEKEQDFRHLSSQRIRPTRESMAKRETKAKQIAQSEYQSSQLPTSF